MERVGAWGWALVTAAALDLLCNVAGLSQGLSMDFHAGLGDAVLATVLRLVAIAGTVVGVQFYQLSRIPSQPVVAGAAAPRPGRTKKQDKKGKKKVSDEVDPEAGMALLGGSNEDDEEDEVEPIEPVAVAPAAAPGTIPKAEEVRSEDGFSELGQRGVLGALLLFCLLTQCFCGIKLASTSGGAGIERAILVISLVLANVEMWCVRRVIDILFMKNAGITIGEHHHPLYPCKMTARWCDLCGGEIVDEVIYCCAPCGFDVCKDCWKERMRVNSAMKAFHQTLSTLAYLKRLTTIMTDNYWLIAVGLLLTGANSALSVARTFSMGSLLDSVAAKNRPQFLHESVVFLVISLISGVATSFDGTVFRLIGVRLQRYLREVLFQRSITQPIPFFDMMPSGDLLSRITQATNLATTPIINVFPQLLSASFNLIGGASMCFRVSWRLTVIGLTSIGPLSLIMKIYLEVVSRLQESRWGTLINMNRHVQQAIAQVRVIRAFGMEDKEVDNYRRSNQNHVDTFHKEIIASTISGTLAQWIELGTTVLIMYYGGSLALEEVPMLTLGELVSFTLYWNMMRSAFEIVWGMLGNVGQGAGPAGRVFSIIDNAPKIDPEAGIRLAQFGGSIVFDHVGFHYQTRPDSRVLRDVSFRIEKNKVTALVGKSGCGKTTIINMLLRFYEPVSGRITVDGIDLLSLNMRWLHQQIAWVAQDTPLFSTTIERNIAYGQEDYRLEDVVAAAKLAQAHDFIMTFEDGYRTTVGAMVERGAALSGGQRQRIAIARAIMRKAPLLLLDEATSSLDAESEAAVQEAIDRLLSLGNMTVVLVAHRLSTVIGADKIVVIHEGQVAEEGKHDELIRREGGLYARFFKRQAERMVNHVQDSSFDL